MKLPAATLIAMICGRAVLAYPLAPACQRGLAELNVSFAKHGYRIQRTVNEPVKVTGPGVHSGKETEIRILPAPGGTGIVFAVVEGNQQRTEIDAHIRNVQSTQLSTVLADPAHPEQQVKTVEHLLSALYALGVTNAVIEVSGGEIPIGDGSALPFAEAVLKSGLRNQAAPAETLKIKKPVSVDCEGAVCRISRSPSPNIQARIAFPHPLIGMQTYRFHLTPETFLNEIAPARTFGFESDWRRLKAAGLARGASLGNTLVFSSQGILNPEGERFPDEPVRHKILDAIGDFSLCGLRFVGNLVTERAGHTSHAALLRAIAQNPARWRISLCKR